MCDVRCYPRRYVIFDAILDACFNAGLGIWEFRAARLDVNLSSTLIMGVWVL